jgi:hypothetical protein
MIFLSLQPNQDLEYTAWPSVAFNAWYNMLMPKLSKIPAHSLGNHITSGSVLISGLCAIAWLSILLSAQTSFSGTSWFDDSVFNTPWSSLLATAFLSLALLIVGKLQKHWSSRIKPVGLGIIIGGVIVSLVMYWISSSVLSGLI